ncbi:MAG: hypothetical protein ACPGXI_16685 [Mycobacterium sp.]
MRLLLIALLVASCTDPVAQDDRDPGFPDGEPFDSVPANCAPGDSVVNGQVQFICPAAYARPLTHTEG